MDKQTLIDQSSVLDAQLRANRQALKKLEKQEKGWTWGEQIRTLLLEAGYTETINYEGHSIYKFETLGVNIEIGDRFTLGPYINVCICPTQRPYSPIYHVNFDKYKDFLRFYNSMKIEKKRLSITFERDEYFVISEGTKPEFNNIKKCLKERILSDLQEDYEYWERLPITAYSITEPENI